MRKLELMELNLMNFKGIEQFNLITNGGDIKVFGDNATGKTTLFDAFTWLLFGKDSKNQSDFEIKGLDENGNVKQHGLNHAVEAVFKLENDVFTLKRVYSEKWTKKRGSRKAVFSGHTTDYYIDDVPKKKKEYDEKIQQIIPEDIFKLLTNPLYFNNNLGWKERREILIELAGNVTDDDILESNEGLKNLIERLNGKDMEDMKKIIAEKKKDINKELDMIPIRIDEIQLSMDDVSSINQSELEQNRADLMERIEKAREELESVQNGTELNNKRKELSDIDLLIAKIKNGHEHDGMNDIYKLKAGIQEKESNIKLLQGKIEAAEDKISVLDSRMEEIDIKVQDLRKEWVYVDSEQFNHDENCLCPTCKQDLPKEEVEKAIENFNINKAERLESIVQAGIANKNALDEMELKRESIRVKKEGLEKDVMKEQARVDKMKSELQDLETSAKDIKENEKYIELTTKKEAIEESILEMMDSQNVIKEEIKDGIRHLEIEKDEIDKKLNKLLFAEKSKVRIKELEEVEKRLAGEYEKLEKEIFQIDEYTKTKINLLEDKINNFFEFATFKLFEEQINGGLKETCETLFQGVPYSRGLNNASKINIGLDIINALNSHFNMSLPIFIDNSESVTRLIETESQLIQLVVSERHKQLEVLPDKETEKTA